MNAPSVTPRRLTEPVTSTTTYGANSLNRLIKLPSVMERTALSRSEIYRRVRNDPAFPKPITQGATSHVRSVAWVESEVDAYIRACIAQRDAKGEEA